MNNKYDIVFCLENDSLIVIEIKRLGMPEGTEKTKIFSWLLFVKDTCSLERLIFKSMSREPGNEVRGFEQADLQFGTEKGVILIDEQQQNLIVNNLSGYVMPSELNEAIDSYLEGAE